MEENSGGDDDDQLVFLNMHSDWDTVLLEADATNFTSICEYFPNTPENSPEMKLNQPSATITSDVVPSIPEEYSFSNVLDPVEKIDTDILTQQLNAKIASSRPANQDWDGRYKFTLSFEKEGKLTNGTDWTFSPVVNKLYVNMDTSCPILFHTSMHPPTGSIIRAIPVFLKPKHTSEVVLRCLLHRDLMDPSNLNSADIVDHLIRCEAMNATYHCEPVTQRRSVTVPYGTPAKGTDFICYVYKFMCFCSCTGGGICKRPLQIIFTLEHRGEVIGRKVLNIRICASPGRDRKSDEEKETGCKKSSKRGLAVDKGHCSKTEPSKRMKVSGDDVYVLHVKGKKNYKTLKYLNELMQFRDAARNSKDEDDSS